MGDPDIRKALRSMFKVPADARVVEEMCLRATPVRVDMAIIGPTELVGFEIKSEVDSMVRLPRQIAGYDTIFDKCILVCATNHLHKVEPLLPPHWGLVKVVNVDNTAQLSVLRRPQQNPRQSPAALAGMLWAEEARECCRQHDVDVQRTATRNHRFLAKSVPVKALRDAVVNALRRRPITWLSPDRL